MSKNKSEPTQTEVDIILMVAKRIAPKFKFGYFDVEDIIQEAFIIGLDGLSRYNGSAPLENFLSVHISNRLKSFLRDNYYRRSGDCEECKGENVDCEKCAYRRELNQAKKNLMCPLPISDINDEEEPRMWMATNFQEETDLTEILDLINMNLDMSLRADYLRMQDGITIPRAKREKIEEEILDILEYYGYDGWRK